MLNITASYTDLYQLTMSEAYFLSGKMNGTAVFDYFFRKLPFNGGYVIFSGLADLLKVLENLHFNEEDIHFLSYHGFDPDFLEYLKDFRFKGNIRSLHEGDVVFPTMPVLQVEADIIEAQIVETLLLNILNFQSLIATKARRIREVASDHVLIDFGMRRAQGFGSYFATRASIIGGFDLTSNVLAAKDFDIPVSGTMAHSFIQAYDDELTAFRAFSDTRPDDCVLLVDTYNTLQSGLPNAIKVANEMEVRGKRLKAIRLDSGDLAFLSKTCRKVLDKAGLQYVKIAASNQLNEYLIKSLLDQDAPIDIFGVGTNLVVGEPDAALDGVYKLCLYDNSPRIKLSENLSKITLPHRKQVFRVYNKEGVFRGADVISLQDENEIMEMHHPFDILKSMSIKNNEVEALLHPIMENGKRLEKDQSLKEIFTYSQKRFSLLPAECKRFDNPHEYKVGISPGLRKERDKLLKVHNH